MKWLTTLLCVPLALFPASSAAANDPFLDLLNNRGNDRDAILRDFEDAQNPTPPPADDGAAPTFAPIEPQPPAKRAAPLAAPTDLALVLPTVAPGLTGAAAWRFHEGCLRGLRAANASTRVGLYETTGDAASALAAYERAAADGAGLIIGPMKKESAQAVARRYPQAPAPTILLQPARGDGYYVLTLNLEREIAELARLLRRHRVMIVMSASPLSRRQATAFAAAWGGGAARRTAAPLRRFYAHDPKKDWQRLFEELKETVERTEDEGAPLALFAAGDAAFVRNVRNFAPQSYPVYASSLFHGGERGQAARFLENLRVMEMPWFFPGDHGDVEDARTRGRPILQQRFYALGADACRIANLAAAWHDGWRFNGVSGAIELREDGAFARRGILARYGEGKLISTSP